MGSSVDPNSIRLRERLTALGANLWWSWDQRLEHVMRRIDPSLWEHLRHNPTAFAQDVTDERLVEAAPSILPDLIAIEDSLAEYLGEPRTWAASHCRGVANAAIAYFSPEFCIHGSLPIYSGGLGVLAGDHLKSCSILASAPLALACSTGTAIFGSTYRPTVGRAKPTTILIQRDSRSRACSPTMAPRSLSKSLLAQRPFTPTCGRCRWGAAP